MKILITGGLGFVGTRLVEYFSKNEQNHVVVSTRRTTSELKDISFPENVSFVNIYALQDSAFEELLNKTDAIIHLAALNEIDSVKYLQKAISVNIGLTVDLLERAKKSGVKKFIYFSTAHVYGSPLEGNIHENLVCRPTHPYSITHKGAEDFVLMTRDKTDMDAVVIRLSNSFGTPAFDTSDRWTLLVNDLCKQAVTEHKLKLRSAGLQLRDFIGLGDVCKGTEILLSASKLETSDGIFNLGSGQSESVIDMTRMIQKRYKNLTGNDAEIVIPADKKNMDQAPNPLNYSIEKLKKLGFEPKNDFEEEIDKMLTFCIKKFSAST